MNSKTVGLIEELNRVTLDEIRANLDREMFSGPSARELFGLPPTPAPTWRDRLRWKIDPVRWYFSTLAKAIRGVNLVDPEDYD